MQMGLHCGTAEAQRLGGRGTRESLDVTKDEDGALVCRELGNRVDDSFHLEASEGGVFGGRRGDRGERATKREPRSADALVSDDLKHPGPQSRGGAEGADLPEQDD